MHDDGVAKEVQSYDTVTATAFRGETVFSDKRERQVQEFISTSVETTYEFGKALGQRLVAGDLVAFTGDLGAGKTSCVQGIAAGLGVREQGVVTSPTFTLIQEYAGQCPIYHFDVYRLHHEDDLFDLGYEEYFYGEGVTLVEWAERIPTFLPAEHLALHLHIEPDQTRRIALRPYGEHYTQLISSLSAALLR